jgi:transglutaminase/protease-like cytokinesis protein 3
MPRLATMYICTLAYFILFTYACADKITRMAVKPEPSQALQQIINPQDEERSLDAGLVFLNKDQFWVYQPDNIHPVAQKLKEDVSQISDHINDTVFALTVKEALKAVTVDTAAGNIKTSAEYQGKDLTAFEKIKILHDFVAIYLTYDDTFKRQNMRTNYKTIIKSRHAVCSGYVILFKAACDFADIPGVSCKNVLGYAKRMGMEDNINGKKRVEIRQRWHVWNMVEIQGFGRYLIDTTMDSALETLKGDFINQYSASFLFADPAAFIYNHFPKDPSRQLMRNPVNMSVYKALPYFDISFFAKGMKALGLINAFTETNEDNVESRFLNKNNVRVHMVITDIDANAQQTVLPVTDGNINIFKYTFSLPGLYEFGFYLEDELAGLYYFKHI